MSSLLQGCFWGSWLRLIQPIETNLFVAQLMPYFFFSPILFLHCTSKWRGKKRTFAHIFFSFIISSGAIWHRHERILNQPVCESCWIKMKERNTHTHMVTLMHTRMHRWQQRALANKQARMQRDETQSIWPRLPGERFKAHWHGFNKTAQSFWQTSSVVPESLSMSCVHFAIPVICDVENSCRGLPVQLWTCNSKHLCAMVY